MRFFSGRISTRKPTRQAFTLIEILIATTVTLMMMAALSVGFKRLGDGITEGRAKLNLTDRLRSVSAILRNDLEGMTAHPDPTSAAESVGYFKYYEGPITGYSATLATMDTTKVAAAEIIPDSRYGDTDDILMLTSRAGQDWYRGKVPLAILKAVQNNALSLPLDNNVTLADWFTPVVISSEYAEIVYFTQPRREMDSPIGLGLPTDAAVPTIGFLDSDANGIPDEFILHRRVLLIRPDLNISSMANQLFWVDPANPGSPAYFEQLLAQEPTTELGNMLGMRYAHTNCDLSIRRVPNSAGTGFDSVAANSLEDLRAPENRFGHFVLPTLDASTSMPILALNESLTLAQQTVGFIGISEKTPNDPTDALSGEYRSFTGCLHPYLALGEYVRSSVVGVTSRFGQDILAANVLGLDIRGFDPSVVLYHDGGGDGQPGVALVDDDADGNTDSNDPQEFGLSGTDDLVLSPNDPGYASSIFSASPVVAAVGGFVDLNWGPKTMTRGAFIANGTNTDWPTPVITDSRWFTGLSGFSLANYSAASPTAMQFTSDLYKSGLVVHGQTPPGPSGNTIPFAPSSFHIYQPSYDSWTNSYEVDGRQQKKVSGFLGNIWINHQIDFGGSGDDTGQIDTANQIHRSFTQVDSGADGLDNDLTGGPDDVLERETSSPYPFIMPAVQVTVRMEDAGTRLVQQMSVVYDFISQ
jgi:Prokaryotic N-terminal methylation motif